MAANKQRSSFEFARQRRVLRTPPLHLKLKCRVPQVKPGATSCATYLKVRGRHLSMSPCLDMCLKSMFCFGLSASQEWSHSLCMTPCWNNFSKVKLEKKFCFEAPAGRSSSCLLYTSPSPRDTERSRMPSSA